MLGCGLVDQLFYLDIYLLSFWWGPLWGCGTSFQWLKAGQVRSFLKLATYVYVGNRNAKNGQKKRVKTQEKSPVQMYKFKRHSWAICQLWTKSIIEAIQSFKSKTMLFCALVKVFVQAIVLYSYSNLSGINPNQTETFFGTLYVAFSPHFKAT